jgi:trans-aconitate methyltransferase
MWSLGTIIVVAAVVGITSCTVVYALLLGIGPVPTSRSVRRQLTAILPPDVTSIAELGCGWGTLLRCLSHHYPNSRIVGYERSPFPCILAWLSRWLLGLSNVRVRWKNFFSASLHQTDLVVCYLFPRAMSRLSPKFRSELRPGSWIVAHTFALPEWTPYRLVHADDLYRTPIYIYRV